MRPARLLLATLSVGLIAAAGAAVAGVARPELVARRRAVTVDGRVVPHDDGAWLEALRARLGDEQLVAFGAGSPRLFSRRELGVELDVADMMERVRRARQAFGAPWASSRSVEVPPRFRVDRARAASVLEPIAKEVWRAPVNARLDLAHHVRVDDVPGEALDVPRSVEALLVAVDDGADSFDLSVTRTRAEVTSDALARVDVSKVLSTFETTFTTWGSGAGRAVNIANAAGKLDGLVLGAGETLSFNEIVGERTLARGFTYAPEIVGDELETGVGGGTCQVASTLHAAALFGAMEIVDRRSHGRPSSYTKLGLDATVAWGKVDLRIKNPYPHPVMIHAFLPKATAVRVELLGGEPQAKVDYKYGINRSDDFFRRITMKRFLKPGAVMKHQKGSRGLAVVSFVTTTYADGRATERSYTSDYRPVPEVFWVGPGFDEATMPELPEGAARIERRGVDAPPG
ncbi:MAG: VanW family protein [Polyangiaceae bacterium]|nr:VanW family protein [Polyangiaceae bacterium]